MMPDSPSQSIDIYFKTNFYTGFGKSVYICGNIEQFGNWNPLKALRMQFNEGNMWSYMVRLSRNISTAIEYKFIVNSTVPSLDDVIWERGCNRTIDPELLNKLSRREYFIDELWGHRTIKLKLQHNLDSADEFMYVIGSGPYLGNWLTPLKMRRYVVKEGELTKQYWTFIVNVNPDDFYFRYYYVKKNEKNKTMIWERGPARIIKSSDLQKGEVLEHNLKEKQNGSFQTISPVKKSKRVICQKNVNEYSYSEQGFGFQFYKSFGRYYILDFEFQTVFDCDQINENIFVGPYPQNESDVQALVRMGVGAVLNLQTEYDFDQRGITMDTIRNAYIQCGIELVHYEIMDMHVEDFIKKGYQAAKLLRQLINRHEKVYVHCTCGIGRAPATVVLYLNTYQNYSLEEAIKFVKFHRKSFFINYYMIQSASHRANVLNGNSQNLSELC